MKVIKSGTGNDYAVFSADAVEAARRQAHALGIKLYQQQSTLPGNSEQATDLVPVHHEEMWEEPLAIRGPAEEQA